MSFLRVYKSFLFSALLVPVAAFAGSSSGKKEYKIKTMTVKYLSGKDTVSAYLAIPVTNKKLPALIVIHEWWGLTPWMKTNTENFAKRGYVSLAIDLFRGKVANTPDEAMNLVRTLPKERAITDLKSAYGYLLKMPEVDVKRIGSIGWCFGGGYSFQAALNLPDLKTCVINYGELSSDENVIKNIHCPVQCNYGDEDRAIPPSKVKAFDAAAKKVGLDVTVNFFPGVGHAFMNPGNKNGYKKNIADEAWKDIYAFLNKTLK